MLKRRRFKQMELLQDRLATFAKDARDKAAVLPAGPEREDCSSVRVRPIQPRTSTLGQFTGLRTPT